MNFSFNLPGATGALLVTLLVALGCARSGETPVAAAARATATPSAGAALSDVIGALKLVRQEYANAVSAEGGTVADATEYAETELFAEQAEAKFTALAAGPGAPDPSRAAAIKAGLARTRGAVEHKAPRGDVVAEATQTLALLEELLAGAVPEEIRGAVLATARADQAIAAEEIVGEYRVGVTSGPARPIFKRRDGELTLVPPEPGALYVAVLLRERRTKRPLPASAVTAVLDAGGAQSEVVLGELWGDFHQYGANVPRPSDGPLTMTVHASAPAYARHGDMLTHFVQPVTATITAHVEDGALRFDARPVQPSDPDYAVGDDVLQALTETDGTLRDAGPYQVGLIVEGPEPIWTWHDGAPVLQPIAPGATNHVEVVLLDRDTGQLVPDARVALTFLAGGRPVGGAPLHPLLSIFAHYGETLAMPADVSTVRVHVDPPSLGSIDRPRLEHAAELELPLPPRRAAGGAEHHA